MRRRDAGDWNHLPYPHAMRAPWWVILRHGAELQLGAFAVALMAAFWIASDSPLRLGAAAVVMSSLMLVGVREMLTGQVRRVLVARRLGAALLELGLCSRIRGLTPTLIGSSALPGATLVRLWLPSGFSADLLVAYRHDLAEACLVDEVIVERRPGRINTVELVLVHRRGMGERTR